MAWRLTKSMERFRSLVNARWPQRDKASDGTIGDTAHQSSTSGHNPDDTPGSNAEWDEDPDSIAEVRAFDMDSDLRESGTTAQMLVDHLIRLPNLSSVFRYIIFNRKIYRASNSWTAETYTGSNPHTQHIHFSGAYSQAADDNVTFNFQLDEVGHVAITDAEYNTIANRVADELNERLRTATPYRDISRAIGWQYAGNGLQGAASSLAALADTQAIKAKLAELETKTDAILNALAASQDPQALAADIAAILTPAVLASLAETVPDLATLNAAEVQAACEAGIRAVLGGLNE